MFAKFWRPETGVFLGVWLALMFVGRTQLFRDPGTFWHTDIGERMVSTGEFVRADPYTYTFAGKPWIAHQWLGEVVMALAYRVGGFDSLLLLTATLLAGLYAWLAQRLIRAGLHWAPAVIVVVLVIAASSYHFHVRPHIATMILTGILFGLLCDFESGRLPLAGMGFLIPLFMIWTNTHGGTLGGLATLGLAVIGWCVWRLLGKESPIQKKSHALWLLLLIPACGLAVLVNPYGLEMPRTWLSIMGAELPEIIEEHAPLELGSWESWCLMALANLYVFVLVGMLPRWPRATWLIPLVWFVLACTRIRHGPLFAVTAGLAIADMFPHTRWAAWLVRKGSDWFQPNVQPARSDLRPWLLPAIVVLVSLLLQASSVPLPVVGSGWVQLDHALWPVELEEDLTHLRTPETRLFNEFSFGGFVIFFAGPPVFIDDRCELFLDGGLLKDYAAAQSGDVRVLERWAKQYEFTHALTRPGSPFDDYFRRGKNWSAWRDSPAANLYRRRE